MAVPGWPELAASGPSMARPRMTLMARCSRSLRPRGVAHGRRPTARRRVTLRYGCRPDDRPVTQLRRRPNSGDRRGEAVEEASRPPIGPELAGAEHAGRRRGRTSARTTSSASWSGSPKRRMPRPLQVNTRAPSPRRARRAAARRSSSADVGVADLELHGRPRPRPRRRPPPRRPSRSAPSTLRIRKSPRSKSSLVLVDDQADVQALAGQRAVVGVERLDELAAAARAPAARRARRSRCARPG